MIKFSIIIPCYNAEPYIYELLKTLTPQVTDEVEVILIDDGSDKPLDLTEYKWVRAYKQKNKGISKTRNRGLNLAKGEVIGFIDADDLVAENYVEFVLDALKNKEWDYIDLSWKSLENNKFDFKLQKETDSLINPSASTRVFKRSFIGEHRFNEKKDACEDEDFTRHLGIKYAKHIAATEYMYFYRTTTPGSNVKRFLNGDTETKRIVYYFRELTENMTYLIDEIKKEDETNEVIVMTNKNNIPELELYAQFMNPMQIKAYEARGEQTGLISVMPKKIQTQVAIYIGQMHTVGGIETFTYAFCSRMREFYDIAVVYDNIPTNQLVRLSGIVRTIKNDNNSPIVCDSLIMLRILDDIPRNIQYKKAIRMAHCIKQLPEWRIKKDCDYVVNVSQASKDSFGDEAKDGIVIHNPTIEEDVDRCLLLVSALRVGATDKQGNDARCVKFASMLDNAGIKYIWMYFGDKRMMNEPENMHYGGLKMDMKPYIAKADYLVQLSGSEAFSYSLLEALELHTPVIVTPLEQNKDMRIKDGENAYIVPFEVEGFDVKKILNVPTFEYEYDNDEIVKQWRKLLGRKKPKGGYKPIQEVAVIVTRSYHDIQMNKPLMKDTRVVMPYGRAMDLQDKGFVRLV